MKFIKTTIPDVKIIEPQVFGDERGFFMETFRTTLFNENCGVREFVQENHSKSSHGILRGLHFQTENTQGKLVRVTKGEVFDVAVDLRESSATFGQLWVPEGFAHGFYVTSEEAEFVYKCTDVYNPTAEVSIKWNDPTLNIDWPLGEGILPSLSAKDEDGLSFIDAAKFK